ncbi:MAG TPA: hypothetical protein VHI52_14305, partial [Verrucomicrobiae bacterium]|nr:hypothetical protein [Verrucomicrobiae bacterium]
PVEYVPGSPSAPEPQPPEAERFAQADASAPGAWGTFNEIRIETWGGAPRRLCPNATRAGANGVNYAVAPSGLT